MDYLYTPPIATTCFHASDMILSLVYDAECIPSQCKNPLFHPKQTVQPPYIQPSHQQA